jgi:hypothetical protein
MTFATPPTVGNAIVVPFVMYSVAVPTCTDSSGNSYQLVAIKRNGTGAAGVFASRKVAATGSPFTVTISGGLDYEACAIEVGGVVNSLIVDQTTGQTGTSAAPSTGSTTGLSSANVFVVAVAALQANQTAITVEAVTPTWTQELENFNYTATVAGEADSRALTGVQSTPQSCSWTNSTTSAWSAVIVAFREAAPVVLLIGAESGIVDESFYARTLTTAGNAAQTTAQAKYGVGSLTFDGIGDRIVAANSPDFALGTGDFTVEGWFRFVVKQDSQALLGQWGSGGNSWYFYVQGGQLVWTIGATLGFTWAPVLGTWYHLAVDRNGTTTRIYINGAVVATSATMNTITATTEALVLGTIGQANQFASFDFNGQMDEIRVTKGVAQYAGAFTPPTGPFDRGTTSTVAIRVTQDTIESLTQPVPALRVTQDTIESLTQPVPAINVTQLTVEVLGQAANNFGTDLSSAQVSQTAVEVLFAPAISRANLSQVAVEVMFAPSSTQPAKLSQVAVEVMYLPGPSGAAGVTVWMGEVGGVIWVD